MNERAKLSAVNTYGVSPCITVCRGMSLLELRGFGRDWDMDDLFRVNLYATVHAAKES